ncbi:hypothetical protein K439DRAFT_1614432 [Ramaria rubella]|nr:hypothetical protein K439DRAFT_1614432 [Ramaria rubella]
MKVMVTTNIDTDLDVANRSHGEIVGIALDLHEEKTGNSTIVELEYPPTYILVKLQRTRGETLEGVDECVIPIEPAKKTFNIQVPVTGKKSINRRVTCWQLPLTGAYAFTDYQSQGQTIPYVIIDIVTPPTGGKLTLFNLYVALSCSSGRDTIRLLHDFDNKLFMQELDPCLQLEDTRLRELNKKTQEWWEKLCSNNNEAD